MTFAQPPDDRPPDAPRAIDDARVALFGAMGLPVLLLGVAVGGGVGLLLAVSGVLHFVIVAIAFKQRRDRRRR